MTLWQKEYKIDQKILNFTVGSDNKVDENIVKYDCISSIAHVKMLAKLELINKKDSNELIRELNKIIELAKQGKFKIVKSDEDSHMAIEKHITKKLGDAGKKIHMARSRNDQVITALRLYYKSKLSKICNLIDEFIFELEKFYNKFGKIKVAGYTHTRKAMPSTIGLWVESFIHSMKDNKILLKSNLQLIDQLPLGTGAGYGLPIKINRDYLKKQLGFKKIQKNPIYVQNSRGKFESSVIHCLSQIMFDINKISTDLILFSTNEYGYFEIPEKFCTGSSIMPHKKNPDVLELLRAKYHQIISYEFQIKSMISNLISGYNRDIQLTKEPVLKSIELTTDCIEIITYLFKNLKINKTKCGQSLTKELYSVQNVYNLVKKGSSFRDAYKKVAKRI